jgi:sulfur carrier protein
MKVKLRNPDRVVEVSGPSTVAALLAQLDIVPEAVLVIRDATLLTRDEPVNEEDELEVRPVLSGGAQDGAARTGVARSDGLKLAPERSGAARPQRDSELHARRPQPPQRSTE